MSDLEKAIMYVKGGASVRDASTVFSVPVTSLRNKLRDEGIQSPEQLAWQTNNAQKSNVRELRKSGCSYSVISKRTGVSQTSVKRWCTDIVLTEKQTVQNLRAETDKQEKAVALRKKGKYITEIAKELECSKSSVSLWLSNYIEKTGNDINKKAEERKLKENAPDKNTPNLKPKKLKV